MKEILILNGPNLNLLGKREPEMYGYQTFESFFQILCDKYEQCTRLHYFQSNTEGIIIEKLHEVGFSFQGIVLNAGAYTHSSIAIADAIGAITTPVVEVHISNVYQRENFRHKSYLSAYSQGIIVGFGLKSYQLAVEYFAKMA